MDFYQYLIDRFGTNEPILFSEIEYKNYSDPWLYKALNRLCEEGLLSRFEKGIYYIPSKTLLGTSILDPRKVIEKKYVGTDNNRLGYYSGVTFLNQIGISTQMPNVIEVYTNKETGNVREVNIGSQRVLLRRARTPITAENAAVQSFLEMMNTVPAAYFDDERRRIVSDYIASRGITRADISEYAPAFPDKAMRTMIESEVIYSVTR